MTGGKDDGIIACFCNLDRWIKKGENNNLKFCTPDVRRETEIPVGLPVTSDTEGDDLLGEQSWISPSEIYLGASTATPCYNRHVPSR